MLLQPSVFLNHSYKMWIRTLNFRIRHLSSEGAAWTVFLSWGQNSDQHLMSAWAAKFQALSAPALDLSSAALELLHSIMRANLSPYGVSTKGVRDWTGPALLSDKKNASRWSPLSPMRLQSAQTSAYRLASLQRSSSQPRNLHPDLLSLITFIVDDAGGTAAAADARADGTSALCPRSSVVSTTVNGAPFLVAFSIASLTWSGWTTPRLMSARCLSRPHLDRLVLTPMEIYIWPKWTFRFDSQSWYSKHFMFPSKKNHSWWRNSSNHNACVHQDTSKWIKMTGMLGEFLMR